MITRLEQTWRIGQGAKNPLLAQFPATALHRAAARKPLLWFSMLLLAADQKKQGAALSLALTLILVCVYAAITIPRLSNADLIEADLGFGMRDYFIASTKAPEMAVGVPSGTGTYDLSLPMRLAKEISVGTSIDPLLIQRAYFVAEPIAVALSGVALVRAALPSVSLPFYFLFLIMFCSGTMRYSNFGTWPSPSYLGLYYAFAEAAGTFAIALALEAKYRRSAVLLAISASCHIIIGFSLGVFVGVLLAVRLWQGQTDWKTIAACVAWGAIPTLAWIALANDWSLAAAGVDSKTWIRLAFAASYHTFPVDAGLFGLRHNSYFTFFVAFALLFVVYFTRFNDLPYRSEISAGMIAVLLVAAFGLWASYAKCSPLILKLHLHRANMVFLIVGAPYVVRGLWNDITSGNIVSAVAAVVTLAGPFYLEEGMALLPAVTMALLSVLRNDRWFHTIIVGVALLFVSAIYFEFWRRGYLRGIGDPSYSGMTNDFFVVAMLGAGVFFTGVARLTRWRFLPFLVVLFFGTLAFRFQLVTSPLAGHEHYARDFEQVQTWARENTPSGTLFVVDPAHSYGWRGISERPTLGSVREWLFTSIIYQENKAALDRGFRIFNAFGLDEKKYLDQVEPLDGYYYALTQLRQTYCTRTRSWYASLAQEFSARFFVFDKAFCAQRPAISIVFENANFYVGKP